MDKINNLYKEVFSDSGEVKPCGREKCKNLIILCVSLYKEKYNREYDFGNPNTGFMNTDNIKRFVWSNGAEFI